MVSFVRGTFFPERGTTVNTKEATVVPQEGQHCCLLRVYTVASLWRKWVLYIRELCEVFFGDER